MKRLLLLLLLVACGESKEPQKWVSQDRPPAGAVRITWLGRAYFLLETATVRVAIDPCGDFWEGPKRETAADLVLTTHAHGDHDAVDLVKGAKQAIRAKGATGEETAQGVKVKSVLTYHDSSGGSERGTNTVYVVELEGRRIAHLGDLGHVLTEEQVREIGRVDILLLPVGGRWTIELADAKRVRGQLHPAVTIPMHAKTARTPDLAHTIDDFVSGLPNVTRAATHSVTFEKGPLIVGEIVVLRDE